MIGGTAISTTSVSGLRSRVFQNLVLKRWRPRSFGAMAVLLGGFNDAVADRRQGAIPEALTSVRLHGPQCVLGCLARPVCAILIASV